MIIYVYMHMAGCRQMWDFLYQFWIAQESEYWPTKHASTIYKHGEYLEQ